MRFNDFSGRESGAGNIGGDAVDAEDAVVCAVIGEQDLEQGNAAAVGSVTVADASAVGVADGFAVAGALGTA